MDIYTLSQKSRLIIREAAEDYELLEACKSGSTKAGLLSLCKELFALPNLTDYEHELLNRLIYSLSR